MYWQRTSKFLLWATCFHEINQYKIELERNFKNLDVKRELEVLKQDNHTFPYN